MFELHTFCDASNCAYAAVCYLIMVYSVCAVFLSCPSRVILRLELSAALLSVQVSHIVEAEIMLATMYINGSLFGLFDSTSVFCYIKNERHRFHAFVAKGVARIQSATKASQWRYVDSKQNPADDASRGLRVEELMKSEGWLKVVTS